MKEDSSKNQKAFALTQSRRYGRNLEWFSKYQLINLAVLLYYFFFLQRLEWSVIPSDSTEIFKIFKLRIP